MDVKFPDEATSFGDVFARVMSVTFSIVMLAVFSGIGFIVWMQMGSTFAGGWPDFLIAREEPLEQNLRYSALRAPGTFHWLFSFRRRDQKPWGGKFSLIPTVLTGSNQHETVFVCVDDFHRWKLPETISP